MEEDEKQENEALRMGKQVLNKELRKQAIKKFATSALAQIVKAVLPYILAFFGIVFGILLFVSIFISVFSFFIDDDGTDEKDETAFIIKTKQVVTIDENSYIYS